MSGESVPRVPLGAVLCGRCRADILAHGWGPKYHAQARGEWSCPDCAEIVGGHFDRFGGGFQADSWLDLPESASLWDRHVRHEAAHAVLAERSDALTVGRAVVNEDVPHEVGGSRDGHVYFEPTSPTGEMPVTDLANAMHAGWASDRLWLTEHGLGQDLYFQVDAAKGALMDMETLAQFVTDPQVHVTARHDTDALVREHDREIRAVADELARHHHLSGDAVRAAINEVTRSSKARAASQKQQSRNTSHAPAPAPVGAAQTSTTPSSSTTNTGGNAMSLIDQARTTLASTGERSNYILGALRQAQLDLETNATEMAGVSNEAQTPTEIAGVYRMAMEQIERVMGLVEHAVTATEVYTSSLHS